MATDLLKPGGYLRLSAACASWKAPTPGGLTMLTSNPEQTGSRRVNHGIHPETLEAEERIEVAEDLPLTDCYVAPLLLPALSSKIFRNTFGCLANPLC